MNRRQRREARFKDSSTFATTPTKKSNKQIWLLAGGLAAALVVFVASLANGRGLDTIIMAVICVMFAIALLFKVLAD